VHSRLWPLIARGDPELDSMFGMAP
jgi:hypothetical protein